MRRRYCLTFRSRPMKLFWTRAGMIRWLEKHHTQRGYASPFKRSSFWPHTFVPIDDLLIRSTAQIRVGGYKGDFFY